MKRSRDESRPNVPEGRVPPYNKEAEQAILGAILLNNAALESAETYVRPESFYIEAHRRIFKAMLEVRNAGQPIDAVTLGNRLITNGDLERIGGTLALEGLTEACATTANVDHYAAIVSDLEAARRMIYAAQQVVAEGFGIGGGGGVVDFVAKAHSLVTGVEVRTAERPRTLFSYADDVRKAYDAARAGVAGLPTPWPTINSMTGGLRWGTITAFVARPAVGKCVRGDTPVLDPTDGRYRTIEQVVSERRNVLSRKENGSIARVMPSAFLPMGKKECLCVKLFSGRELSGTPEHPVMTQDGWKRLDRLTDNDYVECVSLVEEPDNPSLIPDDEVVVLAALLAEGGYTTKCVNFSNQDEEILRLVSRAMSAFDCEIVHKGRNRKKCDWRVRNKNRDRKCGEEGESKRNLVRCLLDAYGCGHKKSKEKVIPESVFSLSNKKLSLFLGVIFGCDGYFTSNEIAITLASKKFIYQIQRLLLRFGVLSSIRYKPVKLNGKIFDSWRLRVYSNCNNLFAENIDPIIPEKRKRLMDKRKDYFHPNADNIPIPKNMHGCMDEVISKLSKRDRVCKLEEISRRLGMSTRISPNKIWRRPTVSRRIMREFIDVFDLRDFDYLTRNHWDKVESISDDGIHEVYDLTVENDHSFVANDIVVHNSTLAILTAKHVWELPGREERILLISPEMSAQDMAERYFVADAKVPYMSVVRGQLSDFETPKLWNSMDRLRSESRLWVLDAANDELTERSIDAAIKSVQPTLVAIDSFYDLVFPGRDDNERVRNIARWLYRSSKRNRYASVVGSQQNREQEKAKNKGGGSRLGTIAFSDAIAQRFDAIFAMERDQKLKDARRLKLVPLKIRRGFGMESVELKWDWTSMDFSEVDGQGERFQEDAEAKKGIPY
jgi:replicative DNA helicase